MCFVLAGLALWLWHMVSVTTSQLFSGRMALLTASLRRRLSEGRGTSPLLSLNWLMWLGRDTRQLLLSHPSVGKKWARPFWVSWEFYFGNVDGMNSGSWRWKSASQLMWGQWRSLRAMARLQTLWGSSSSDNKDWYELEETTQLEVREK